MGSVSREKVKYSSRLGHVDDCRRESHDGRVPMDTKFPSVYPFLSYIGHSSFSVHLKVSSTTLSTESSRSLDISFCDSPSLSILLGDPSVFEKN